MNPISTYDEKLIEGEFVYTLYEDRLVVKGEHYLRSKLELEFELNKLSSSTDKIVSRSQYFTTGIWWTSIAAICASTFISVFDKPIGTIGPTVSLIMAGGGLIFTLATSKKLEHTQFKFSNGGSAFAMTKSGKQCEFEDFIEALKNQIKKQSEQNSAHNSGSCAS